MPELLPGSIADDRFRLLERVTETRFAGIDQSKVLVMLVDHVDASALDALAWQFGALDSAWRIANEAEKRELLKRILPRRKRRGTPWAIQDALDVLGHDSVIREHTHRYHDGTIRRDGTFTYEPKNAFHFWVIALGDRPRADLQAVVDDWKRLSTRGEVFFVWDLADANVLLAYSVLPFGEWNYFDEVFDMVFESEPIAGHELPPLDIFDDTFDVSFE